MIASTLCIFVGVCLLIDSGSDIAGDQERRVLRFYLGGILVLSGFLLWRFQ